MDDRSKPDSAAACAPKIVLTGPEAPREGVRCIGSLDLLGSDGELDRAKVAGIVFNDAAALKDLNGIVHPAVTGEILGRVAAQAPAAREAGMAVMNDGTGTSSPAVPVADGPSKGVELSSAEVSTGGSRQSGDGRPSVPTPWRIARTQSREVNVPTRDPTPPVRFGPQSVPIMGSSTSARPARSGA